MDRQRLLSGVKAASPLTGNGRRRRLPIPPRKPTLAKSGVLRTAGYGFNCEIKLSARSGHWLVSYNNDFNLLFLIGPACYAVLGRQFTGQREQRKTSGRSLVLTLATFHGKVRQWLNTFQPFAG